MISIAWVSRNDDHGRGLVARIQIAADALCEYHRTAGLDTELIIVEWNPPKDKPKLRECVHFHPDYPVRWYEVSKEVHQAIPNWQQFGLWNHIGTNVGLRRAKGEWVLCTTHDIVFSRGMASFLAMEQLSHDAFYRADRIDGKLRYRNNESTKSRISYLRSNVVRQNLHPKGGMFTKACGDFILMGRDEFWKLKGYTEWPINGMYFDGLLMYRAAAMGLRQKNLGPPVYHVEHADRGLAIFKKLPHISHKQYKNVCAAMMKRRKPIDVNPPSWGLGTLREIQVEDNVWRLEPPYRHLPRKVEL